MKLLLAAAACVALLLFPRAADACSCVGDVPLCQSFWQADVVFSGEVVSFEKLDAKQHFSRRVARIRVDRVWRGEAQGTVDVTTGAGGGDCGYSFRPGRKYLVYSSKANDGKLTTGICSPTKPLDAAAADLAYFKEIEKPSAGARVYGSAHLETKGADLEPAKGATITLDGASGPRTTRANDVGAFEFTNLTPGEYRVRMEGAATPPWQVTIRDARQCVRVNLWAQRPAKLESARRESTRRD
jgi:hypothetical protein